MGMPMPTPMSMPMPVSQPMPQPQQFMPPAPQQMNPNSFKPFVPGATPPIPHQAASAPADPSKPKGFADMMNSYEAKAIEKHDQQHQDFDDAYGNEYDPDVDYGEQQHNDDVIQ